MALSQAQRRELIESAKVGIEFIDTTIERLKLECPEAFHTDKTLLKRRFHHKPATPTLCRNVPDEWIL
jgi:hypothetical protein